MKWTVCFWRSRAAPAEGGPMCPASPTGRARGLTWRLCRAGVQPPGPGSCPPHRRRRPAGPALWHRSEAAGERPGPRPRTPQALALPASAELGRARGTPPAGAAHTPTRQEGLQLTGEGHPPGGTLSHPTTLPFLPLKRPPHRCTPASSGGRSPEPAAPAPGLRPSRGRGPLPRPQGPAGGAWWGHRWLQALRSCTAPCSCSGQPPGGGGHSCSRQRPGSAARGPCLGGDGGRAGESWPALHSEQQWEARKNLRVGCRLAVGPGAVPHL